MMEAGSYFLHLKEFSEFMSNPSNQSGQVLENFAISISEFLSFYQNEVNTIYENVKVRRMAEVKNLFNEEGESRNKISFLEMRIHLMPLISQIRLLSVICFTKKFIEDKVQEFDEPKVEEEGVK